MRFAIIPAVVATLALSACGGEARRTGPMDARLQRSLASVSLNPATAAAMLTAYRQSRGLGSVRLDPALNAMAQRQANAMAGPNEMSHNVNGSFSARLAAVGLRTSEAGENVGAGYFSTAEAMRGWEESPEHNANLLLPKATRFGVALAKDASTGYGTYWAMVVAAEPLPEPGPSGLLVAPGQPR